MQKAFLVLAAMPGRPGTKKLSNLLVNKRSNRRMKKQLIFLAIAASLVLFACGDPDPVSDTEVTISNQSRATVYDVVWNGYYFYSTYTRPTSYQKSTYYIKPGEVGKSYWLSDGFQSRPVSSGSGYVFFRLSAGGVQYRSLKKLTVSSGEVVTFYITNDTVEAKQQ
jgi:hypothetical protein